MPGIMRRRKKHICCILMEEFSMFDKESSPEVIVFAGPNGSGKSTITRLSKTLGVNINAGTKIDIFSSN